MKKLLRFSALLTLAALLMPALATAFSLRPEIPGALALPAPPPDRTAAEFSPALPIEKGFDETASVELWTGSEAETLTLRDYLEGVLAEVIDISPGNLDFSLCFFQSSVFHDVLCI